MSARTRLALGLAGVAATASVVRRDRVGARELRAFHVINDLPDELDRPVWVVMQAGALGASAVAAAVARASGRRDLATRLLVDGVCAWTAAKAVKRRVQRPRPAVLVRGTRSRGKEASGLGYVSGHAAVSTALAAAAMPYLGPRGRAAVLVTVPAVGLARVYVGAHLPLDVVGGAAVGLACDSAVTLAGTAVRARGSRFRPGGR